MELLYFLVFIWAASKWWSVGQKLPVIAILGVLNFVTSPKEPLFLKYHPQLFFHRRHHQWRHPFPFILWFLGELWFSLLLVVSLFTAWSYPSCSFLAFAYKHVPSSCFYPHLSCASHPTLVSCSLPSAWYFCTCAPILVYRGFVLPRSLLVGTSRLS